MEEAPPNPLYPWVNGSSEYPVAIDVGCGSGRDLVYLAETLPASWRVIGVDNHSYALDRATALAQRRQALVEVRNEDLRKQDSLHGIQADLVHGCRFLDRSLLFRIRDEVSFKILRPRAHSSRSTHLTPTFLL